MKCPEILNELTFRIDIERSAKFFGELCQLDILAIKLRMS
jgi:hypothetical protein